MKVIVKKKRKQAPPADITPYDYQEPVIKEHVKRFKMGADSPEYVKGQHIRMEGSDMGSGKTIITCMVAKQLKAKLAVICPKTSIPVWEKWAKLIGCQVHFIHNYESLIRSTNDWVKCPARVEGEKAYAKAALEYGEKCLQLGERAFEIADKKPKRAAIINQVLANAANTDFIWDLPEDILVAVDEAHRCKGEESITSQLLIALRKQVIRTLVISASIACGPGEMRAVGYAIGLHSLEDYIPWALTHGCLTSQWGKLEYVAGDSGMQRLHEEIYPKLGCRIRISDLGDRFPETQISADAYDMDSNTKKINAAYEEMETEIAKWEAGHSTSKGINPLTIILRARQKVELLKVPAFAEMAKDALEDGMRVLLFMNFTPSVLALAERLKTNCLFAGFNKRERNDWLAKFQANDKSAKSMVLNIAAGAESISAHDLDGRFPRLTLISPSYSAFKMSQALGRVHRAGGKSKSIQRIVYAANTIEQKVCIKVQCKLHSLSTLNDGDFLPDHLASFLAPERAAKMGNGMSLADMQKFMQQVASEIGDEVEDAD